MESSKKAITIESIPRMQVAQLSAILRSGDDITGNSTTVTTTATKDDIITTTTTTMKQGTRPTPDELVTKAMDQPNKSTNDDDKHGPITKSTTEAPAQPKKPTIIDVRDEDRIEGHIPTSRHVPSETFNDQLPALVDDLRDDPVVVFHCALSQQRGPRAAMQYLKARRRLGLESNDDDDDDDDDDRRKTRQKVYILEGGYAAWQELL